MNFGGSILSSSQGSYALIQDLRSDFTCLYNKFVFKFFICLQFLGNQHIPVNFSNIFFSLNSLCTFTWSGSCISFLSFDFVNATKFTRSGYFILDLNFGSGAVEFFRKMDIGALEVGDYLGKYSCSALFAWYYT